jgi:hypothetical protein
MTNLRPDVLLITARQDELDALLALGDKGAKGWQGKRDQRGLRYHLCELSNEKKEPLIVAAAWAGDMGEVAAATRAVHLAGSIC